MPELCDECYMTRKHRQTCSKGTVTVLPKGTAIGEKTAVETDATAVSDLERIIHV
jgi:hypothetical protein